LVNTKDFGHQVASQGTSEIVLPQLSPRSRVPKGVTLLNCETGEQVFLSAESFSLGQNIALAKSFVAEKADMSANKMEILWSGQILEGSRTFSSYGVKAGDVLSVSTSRRRHRMADGGGNRGFGPGAAAAAAVTTAALGGRHRSCGSAKNKPGTIFEWQQRKDYQRPPGSTRHAPVTLFLLDARSGRKQPLPDSVGLGMKVSVVKEIVSYLIGLPAVDMQLCWNGLVLHEGRSLAAYHIQSGQCLHAKRLPSYSDAPQRLQLTILSMESHGKLAIPPFFVEASPMDLVFRVKEKITAAVGIPVSEQRLVFVGRSLSNFSTLEQVGISSDVTLQLALPFEELPDRNLMERNAVLSEHSSSIVIDKARFFLTLHELWPTGRQYRCAVLPDAPISAIRERAAQEAGCLPSDLVLVHYGMKLRDGLNPNFYNLQVGDIIDVAKKPLPIKPPDERPPKGVSASPRKPRAGDLRKSADAISSHSSSSPTSDEAGGAADQQQQQQQQQQQHQRGGCSGIAVHWPPVPPPPRPDPSPEELEAGGWNRRPPMPVPSPKRHPRPFGGPLRKEQRREFSQAAREAAAKISKALVADAVTKASQNPSVIERTRLREMAQDYCTVLMFQVIDRHEAACRYVASLTAMLPDTP